MVFPHPLLSNNEGLLCYGGDLDPERLKCAYHFGIFPWYNELPILWWFTHPRSVLFPEEFRLSKSMKKFVRQHAFRISFNEDFVAVMSACMQTKRNYQEGSWINEDMIHAYGELHRSGFAHSVEVWDDRELIAGLYGITLGKIFFGESMFTRVSNASKLAFYYLIEHLKLQGCTLIDCQQETDHMKSLGAKSMSKDKFWTVVRDNLLKDSMVF